MDLLEAFKELNKLDESWERLYLDKIIEEDPARVITAVITDKRFEPLFNKKQKESIKHNNLAVVGHFMDGTAVKGQAKNIGKLCDDCHIMPPYKQFIDDTI